MYKALIVDDEKLIRDGMKRAIPWETIGIGAVFLAQSGAEALSIIREHKPEILITDIRMHGMTGLDLIAQAKELTPDIKVMVLTGYDEFEYARRSIKLNVNDFFLKPIDEKVFISAIRKQVEAISETKSVSSKYRARAVTEQIEIEIILREIVHGRYPSDRIEAFCGAYGYGAGQSLQAAVLLPALYM